MTYLRTASLIFTLLLDVMFSPEKHTYVAFAVCLLSFSSQKLIFFERKKVVAQKSTVVSRPAGRLYTAGVLADIVLITETCEFKNKLLGISSRQISKQVQNEKRKDQKNEKISFNSKLI